jgi:hypothetical protein
VSPKDPPFSSCGHPCLCARPSSHLHGPSDCPAGRHGHGHALAHTPTTVPLHVHSLRTDTVPCHHDTSTAPCGHPPSPGPPPDTARAPPPFRRQRRAHRPVITQTRHTRTARPRTRALTPRATIRTTMDTLGHGIDTRTHPRPAAAWCAQRGHAHMPARLLLA